MLLDGKYHQVHVIYKSVQKEIHLKGQYTVHSALVRACMAFELPDSAWLNNEAYLIMQQTGQVLDNSLMMCETEVYENDTLTLVRLGDKPMEKTLFNVWGGVIRNREEQTS